MIVDDIGWPERPLMPSLDSLAAQGTTFTRAYSWPVCSLSRLALLFGVYPRREGIGNNLDAHDPEEDRLRLGLFSMAELFAPTHATALFGKWHLGRAPLDNGADLELTPRQLARAQIPVAWYAQGFESGRAVSPTLPNAGVGAVGYYAWWRCDQGLLTMESRYAVDVQRDEFLAWWSSTSEPKMAWLSWSAAHSTQLGLYEAPPGYTAQSTARENYEQVVEYLDAQIALVLSQVDLATTFVVFVSDNGTTEDRHPLGERDGIWKYTTYEGGVRVPLIVAGPGVVAGMTSSRLVSLVDVGATMAELAGCEIPAGFDDSHSFADELGSWKGEPARAFAFTERYTANYDDQAVIEEQWKLRRVDADGNGPAPSRDHYSFLSGPGVELRRTPPPLIRDRLLTELASLPPRP